MDRKRHWSAVKKESPVKTDPGNKEPWANKQKSRLKRTALFSVQMILALVVLGYLAWWGYTSVMEYVLGRYSFFDMGGITTGLYAQPRVMLVRPTRTEKFLQYNNAEGDTTWPYRLRRPDDWGLADTLWYAPPMQRPEEPDVTTEAWDIISSTSQDETVNLASFWRETLYRLGYDDYNQVEEIDLVNIDPSYELVILPGVMLMSEREREGVKQYLADGGNVMMMWFNGVRDENGKWLGHEFMSQVMGALPSQEVYDPTGGTSMIVRGGGPITAGIAPGSHIDTYTYFGYITFNVIEKRTRSDLFWFYPYWKQSRGYHTDTESLAMHGDYVDGRFVWLGFSPDTIEPRPGSDNVVDKLVKNSLQWLSGKPVIAPRVWPRGYEAGGSLMLEVRKNPEPARNILQAIDEEGITLDLAIEADVNPRDLPLNEVSWGDLVVATSRFQDLSEMTGREQGKWVDEHVEEFEQKVTVSPVGLFPANWTYTNATLNAGSREKLNYILGHRRPAAYGAEADESQSNKVFLFGSRKPLSLVPKAQLSMWEWYHLKEVRRPSQLYEAMVNDMQRIRKAGGMYIGLLDAKILEDRNMEKLPIRLAQQMDSLGIRRAKTSELVTRFAGFRNLLASGREISDTRIALDLSNVSDFDLRDVVWDVYFPPIFEDVAVSTQKVGVRATKLSYDPDSGRLQFNLSRIDEGDNIEVRVDLIPMQPDAEDDAGTDRAGAGVDGSTEEKQGS
ncbi:hypothetical protein GF324_08290 [bacterium]|nr:hypothetical protein [bacterium]